MSELRDRMIRDMAVRGLARRTHETYIAAVVRLAKYYRRSPDQLTNDEIQAYLAHLILERKLSWSTCSQAANAFRFLYHVTLGHPRTDFHVPLPKPPQKLPEILSREEVWRLLAAPPHPRHRLLLTTVYAAGLRVSEAIALRVTDIDADRMTIRIEQGKGAKDRYVPLAARLLQDLRAYWTSAPPGVWLFANRQGTRPIDITVAQKIYTMAKRLDPKERATLMRLLIDTLDADSEKGSEDAWRAEVERRVAELDSGAVDTIPWEELRARLYQR